MKTPRPTPAPAKKNTTNASHSQRFQDQKDPGWRGAGLSGCEGKNVSAMQQVILSVVSQGDPLDLSRFFPGFAEEKNEIGKILPQLGRNPPGKLAHFTIEKVGDGLLELILISYFLPEGDFA